MHDLDQEARERANRAIALIEIHERGCVERGKADEAWRNNAAESLQRIESNFSNELRNINSQISGLYSRVWWAAGGVIAGCFAVILLLVGPHLK
jgi:hypothetical protein